MATALTVIAVVIVQAIVVILILAASKPANFRLARSTVIKAPAERIFPLVNDLRNWTAALSFRVRDNRDGEDKDYSVAISVSLKAAPRYGVGDDVVRPTRLLGY